MYKFIVGLFLIALGIFTYTLYGQEVVSIGAAAQLVSEPKCDNMVCELMGKFPDINAALLAMFTMIGLTLRGVAEVLTIGGELVKNKSASDFGQKLASYAVKVAGIVGWFGGGTPRAVLLKKVNDELDRSKPNAGSTDQPK